MSEDIYHQGLMELAKDKNGNGRLDRYDGTARADNPLCGDRVIIDLRLNGDAIGAISQKTRGCVLTQAAAAMIVRNVEGLRCADLAGLREQAARFLRREPSGISWADLETFAPVRDVISRHDCVLIAFQALQEAIEDATTRTENQ